MKRFWLLALLMAGSLTVALSSPAFAARMSSEESSNDSSDETSMEDINSALGSMSAHMNDIDKKLGLTIFGDVRGRYALWTQSQSDPTDAAALNKGTNTISDKGVGRYRVRLGAKETFGDVMGTMRIGTGGFNPSNANSENNTYDNGFGNPPVLIDMASLTYIPSYLNKHVMLTVGKMANPLVTTPMTWDPDINPEGALVEVNWMDTKLRATYFDLANTAGAGQGVSGGVTNTGAASDEYMANLQLEEMIKIDTDTSVDLTLGYEYIPYATALALGSQSKGAGGIGPGVGITTTNTPANAGNIFDYNNTIPDFQIGEGILQVKHKVGDVPMKWTAHVIDNFDSFDVPYKEGVVNTAAAVVTVGTDTAGVPVTVKNSTTNNIYAPTGTKAANGYTKWTNQYGAYVEVKAGDSVPKGGFSGTLALSYVEPNAQLANLASDDANFTNTEYLYEQIGYGLESNVQLLLSVWEMQRVYYSYLGAVNNNALTKTGAGSTGTSQDPEFQIYADALLSF